MDYPTFEDIKQFWDWDCYTKEDLADYVEVGCLTPEEYKQLCGEDYEG